MSLQPDRDNRTFGRQVKDDQARAVDSRLRNRRGSGKGKVFPHVLGKRKRESYGTSGAKKGGVLRRRLKLEKDG